MLCEYQMSINSKYIFKINLSNIEIGQVQLNQSFHFAFPFLTSVHTATVFGIFQGYACIHSKEMMFCKYYDYGSGCCCCCEES